MTWVDPVTDDDLLAQLLDDEDSLREYEIEREDRHALYGPALAWATPRLGSRL